MLSKQEEAPFRDIYFNKQEFNHKTKLDIENAIFRAGNSYGNEPLRENDVESIRRYRRYLYEDDFEAIEGINNTNEDPWKRMDNDIEEAD